LADGTLHVVAGGAQQPRQLATRKAREALGGGALRHLAEVAPPSGARHVPIDAVRQRCYDVY
jgi:hypothetical protein